MEALHGEVGTKKTFATPWLVWNLSRRTAKSAWRPGPNRGCHLAVWAACVPFGLVL